MNRLYAIIIALLVHLPVLAQDVYPAYCDLCQYGEVNTKSITMSLDFGDAHAVDILDDDGNKAKFASPMAAVAIMVQNGWKLLTVYYKNDIAVTGVPTTHYIMEKMVSCDEEVKAGLRLSEVKEKKPKKERVKSDDGVY